MCSRKVSDTANGLRNIRKKKSSAVPLFRSGHMSAICARLGSKGKVGVQRGRETAGVPSFLPPAAGAATFPPSADGESPAEVQRKTSRPLGANPPAAVRVPHSAGAEEEPPRQGEHASGSSCAPVIRCRKGAAPSGRTRQRQFECPTQPVQKRSRPVRANTLTQFARPTQPVQKRSRPLGANPPAAVRAPRSAGAGKRGGRKI